MIETIIKSRMDMAGLTQARLAEEVGCTATQMGVFLKGSGFLSKKSLEKTLLLLGLNLEMYEKRLLLAKEASSLLTSKGVTDELIIRMPKSEMIKLTGLSEIQCLADVNETEFELMIKSGIVDYEGTYPYFKATILHLMQLGEKSTPKSVEISFSKLAVTCGLLATVPVFGISSVIGLATGALLFNKSYSSAVTNALTPLVILAKQILSKSK